MTYTCRHTHTRLLSGKQSQRHGVTETKPQKRRLALCDNPLTHIYIQGLEYASVPPSPPLATLRYHPPISTHPSSHSSPSIYLSAFHHSHLFPSTICSSPPSFTSLSKLSLSWGSSCHYQWMVHGLAWHLP